MKRKNKNKIKFGIWKKIKINKIKEKKRFHASIVGVVGLIPGRGTKIPHAFWCRHTQKKT